MLKNIFERAASILPDFITNRDIRYMDLYGYPIHQPRWQTFWRPGAFKFCAVATAIPVVSAIMAENYSQAALYFVKGG